TGVQTCALPIFISHGNRIYFLSKVVCYIWNHTQKTGSFDRTRELALILSTGSGYTTGKNLSLVVHKPLQQLCIFIINILKSGLGKLTLPGFYLSLIRM